MWTHTQTHTSHAENITVRSSKYQSSVIGQKNPLKGNHGSGRLHDYRFLLVCCLLNIQTSQPLY